MDFILIIPTCVTLTHEHETQGHVMVYVTCVISACMCSTALNLVFVLSGFQVEVFIVPTTTSVTITCDPETQDHVMVYVT